MSIASPATRRRVFTREVLDAIPLWVELGATGADIAAALGTTEGSLYVACSAYKISLRPSSSKLSKALTPAQWSAVQREAARRGVPVWELVAAIVAAVADDNLFAAVLDE